MGDATNLPFTFQIVVSHELCEPAQTKAVCASVAEDCSQFARDLLGIIDERSDVHDVGGLPLGLVYELPASHEDEEESATCVISVSEGSKELPSRPH